MAYAPRELRLLEAAMDGVHQEWLYPTLDPLATVAAASYFADAADRNIKAGDEIIVRVLAGDVIEPTGSVATARRKFVVAAGVYSLAVLD